MAEYWKSTPKYWCKHCSTYVKDTKFERTQHEATGKHQGNLKRFLRGIQNGHDKDERERQRARSEIERLNRAVGGDLVSSTSTTGNALPPPSRIAASANVSQATIADRKRQMAQLAEMGVFVPDEYRREMALAGDWEAISEKALGQEESSVSTVGIRKRPLEDPEEDEVAEQRDPSCKPVKKNRWGTTIKQYPSLPKQDLDSLLAGNLPAKMPKKEEEKDEGSSPPTVKQEDPNLPTTANETTDQHRSHTHADQDSDLAKPPLQAVKTEVKQEDLSPSTLPHDIPSTPDQILQHPRQDQGGTGDAIKDGSGTEAGTVVFKKRKAKNSRQR